MINATGLAIYGMLAGSGVNALGQNKAAGAARKTFGAALKKKRELRARSLAEARQLVDQYNPSLIEQDIARPSTTAMNEADRGDNLARAFADSSGISPNDSGRITGVAQDVRKSALNEARTLGFSQALQRRAHQIRQLAHNNTLLSEDNRRIDEMLPYDLERAGNAGKDLRFYGSLLSGVSRGYLSNEAWKKKNEKST